MFDRRESIKLTLAAFVTLAVLASPLAAGEAPTPFAGACERFFPADTQVFVSVQDCAGAARAFKETGMYEVYGEPSVQKFLAQGVKGISFLPTERVIALREALGAAAFGIFDFRMEDGSPNAQLLVVIEIKPVGEQSDAIVLRMEQSFKAALSAEKRSFDGHEYLTTSPESGPALQFASFEPDSSTGTRFILFGIGADPVPQAMKRLTTDEAPGLSLAQNTRFHDALKRVSVTAPEYVVYVDWEASWPTLRSAVLQLPGLPPDATALVCAILEKLGLDSMRQAAICGGFHDKGAEDAAFISFDGQPRGLFRVFRDKQVPAELLESVPRDAAAFDVVALDHAAGYEVLLDTVGDIAVTQDTDAEKVKIRSHIEQMQAASGLDFAEELRACLGDFTLSYSFLPQSGGLLTGLAATPDFAILIQVRDAERLSRLIEAVVNGLPRETLQITEVQYKEHTIVVIPVAVKPAAAIAIPIQLAVAYCVTDEWLIVSMQSLSIKNALSRLENPGPSVTERAGFRKALEALPDDYVSISYSDTKRSFAYSYGMIVPMLYLSGGMIAAQLDMPFDFSALPDVNEVSRHLFPTVSTVSVTPEGLSARSYGPLGGATVVAAVAGFGLPPLLEPRVRPATRAQATVCMSNLKQIYIACMLYCAEHDDRFPSSLEEIAGDLEARALQCPAQGDPRSAADYAIVPGLSWSSEADLVLAYEKNAYHNGGRHVVFVSGEVEYLAEDEFHKRLRETVSEPEAE